MAATIIDTPSQDEAHQEIDNLIEAMRCIAGMGELAAASPDKLGKLYAEVKLLEMRIMRIGGGTIVDAARGYVDRGMKDAELDS
jgi:hypothetical protein